MPDNTSTLATFRIDAETWHQFKAAAKANKTTASSLLKNFVTAYSTEPTKTAPTLEAMASDLQELSRRLGELSAA